MIIPVTSWSHLAWCTCLSVYCSALPIILNCDEPLISDLHGSKAVLSISRTGDMLESFVADMGMNFFGVSERGS